MFQSQVSTLTLDKIPLVIQSLDVEIPENYEKLLVEDIMYPIIQEGPHSIFLPDYSIQGFFMGGNNKKGKFILSQLPSTTHIMYITGVPKAISETAELVRQKFKIPQPEFLSYWEDSKIGYFIQVIKKPQDNEHQSLH